MLYSVTAFFKPIQMEKKKAKPLTIEVKKINYSVIEGKEKTTVMCKVGMFYLGDNLPQSKLKKLYDFGYTNFITKG